MSFHNIMVDDEPPQPVELQHHDQGFVWIEPNHHVTHATIPAHDFVVKDKQGKQRYALSLHHVDTDEL